MSTNELFTHGNEITIEHRRLAVRKLICPMFVALFASFSASAELSVALGSSSTSVDTEAVTNVAFAVGNSSVVNMRMLLNAQWNNNAEVIFGCDVDGDGALSAEEEMLLVGWDCGSWKAVDCRDQTSTTVVSGDANNNRAYWRIRSDADGLTHELNGAQTRFVTTTECNLATCNMVKVICRGNNSPNLNMKHPASQQGFRVLLR